MGLGPWTLIVKDGRGHPRDMTPRHGKAAAVAALLIGLRLTFDRSWMVPPLLPGTRDDQPPPSGETSEFRHSGSSTREEPVSDDVETSSDEDDPIWRDAPADAASLSRRPNSNASKSAFAATRALGARALKALRGPHPRSPRVTASGSSETEGLRGTRAATSRTSSSRASSSKAASSRSPARLEEPIRTTSPITKSPTTKNAARRDESNAGSNAREAARRRSAPPAPRVGRGFSLFRPPRGSVVSSKRDARPGRAPRPPLLSRLLGRGARRPPQPSLSPPELSR